VQDYLLIMDATDEFLSNVLEYHVVVGPVAHSSELKAMVAAGGGQAKLATLQGGMITVREENGALFVNNAKIVTPDVLTSSGVVHIIDK
jgi:uncharacterized surface protein with fasciclin (FAS1) repeats